MSNTTWTRDEVLEEAGFVRKSLEDMFAKFGSVRPLTWLYATRNPETGEGVKGLVLVPAMGSFDETEKNMYALMQRRAAETCQAVGIIFASEVWMLDSDVLASLTPEEAEAEMRKWGGNFENHPKRVEAIYMQMEHQTVSGTMTWVGRITRDADQKGTLGAWEELPCGHTEGRFANLIPRVN